MTSNRYKSVRCINASNWCINTSNWFIPITCPLAQISLHFLIPCRNTTSDNLGRVWRLFEWYKEVACGYQGNRPAVICIICSSRGVETPTCHAPPEGCAGRPSGSGWCWRPVALPWPRSCSPRTGRRELGGCSAMGSRSSQVRVRALIGGETTRVETARDPKYSR